MIYIFVPYYKKTSLSSKESLVKQTVPYRLIKRDTKASKILWTEALNDFWLEVKRLNTKDDDVIGVMCNDISFYEDLFMLARDVTHGDIFVPDNCLLEINWRTKRLLTEMIGTHL